MKRSLRKAIMLLVAVMALSVCFVFGVSAETEYTEGYYTYVVEDGNAIITEVDKSIHGYVVIPGTLGGYKVTEIGDSAFAECFSDYGLETDPDYVVELGYVAIPEGVTRIGNGAFFACQYLQGVSIPSSVKEIGNSAFAKCVYLGEIIIPEGVESIGDVAFSQCFCLQYVSLPDSLIRIGREVFWDTPILLEEYAGAYYIGNHIIALDRSFRGDFKEGVKGIADYAAEVNHGGHPDMGYRTVLELPDSMTYLGTRSLWIAGYIRTICFPDSLKRVADECLFGALIDPTYGKGEDPLVWYYYEGTESEWKEISGGTPFGNTAENERIRFEYKSSHEHDVITRKYKNQAYCVNLYWEENICDCGYVYYTVADPTGEHEFIYKYSTPLCELTEDTTVFVNVYCSACGEFMYGMEEVVSPSDHIMSDWELTAESTCGKAGKETRYCTYGCGYSESRDLETVPHSMGEWYVVAAPTCSSNGQERRICSACGYPENRETEKVKHNMSSWTVDWEASCISTGRESCRCLNDCGYTETRETEKTSHTMGEWSVDHPASCSDRGREIRRCTYCNYPEYKDIPATGHSMGEWMEMYPATCTDTGTMYRKCSTCGYEEYKDIKATGHKDTDGDGYCNDCGENIAVANCKCNCHKGGFSGFFWKILRIFYKLFKTKEFCVCGVAHY